MSVTLLEAAAGSSAANANLDTWCTSPGFYSALLVSLMADRSERRLTPEGVGKQYKHNTADTRRSLALSSLPLSLVLCLALPLSLVLCHLFSASVSRPLSCSLSTSLLRSLSVSHLSLSFVLIHLPYLCQAFLEATMGTDDAEAQTARLLAVTIFKNGVGKYWRSSATKYVTLLHHCYTIAITRLYY